MDDLNNNSRISATFEQNEGFLKKFVSRFLSRPEDIDDIVQETFLKAYDYERSGKIASPKAFLFKIAKNAALRELTRKSTQITDYIEEIEIPADTENPQSIEERVESQKKFNLFLQAAAYLPDKCRRVFLMRKVFGYSHSEIAAQLNISHSTVEKHLSKGLRICSQLMKDPGLLKDGPVPFADTELDKIREAK